MRPGLAIYPWLVWNSPCSSGWPQSLSHPPPVSVSLVMGPEMVSQAIGMCHYFVCLFSFVPGSLLVTPFPKAGKTNRNKPRSSVPQGGSQKWSPVPLSGPQRPALSHSHLVRSLQRGPWQTHKKMLRNLQTGFPTHFEQFYLHNGLHNDPKGQFGELNTGWSYRVEHWERR